MQRVLQLLFFALFLFPVLIKAQSYQVRLHGVDMADEKIQQRIAVPASFNLQVEALKFVQQIIPGLQSQGFLTASVDSLGAHGMQYDAFVYTGPQYKWAGISFNAIPPELFVAAAINPAQWTDRPLNPASMSRLSENLLRWCEDNGYPFARVWLDSIQITGNGGVYGSLQLDKGALCKIDSVIMNGGVRISKAFLMRYLDIFEGSLYSEKKLRNISKMIRELPFLQESNPWNIQFRFTGTRLNLFLKERNANQLNAIIGLLPNSEATGKFLLTVDAQAAFQNILGYGENLSVSYQKLEYKSLNFKADAVWPYLFNTPFGADGHFELYFKDSTFRRTSLQLGLRYHLRASDYLRVYYQNESNRLGYIDTAYVRANKQLPGNADVASDGAGIEFVGNRTDYKLNPRKGWELRLAGNALVRHIRRSDEITGINDGTGFDYASLYDSLEQKKYQCHLNADAAYYFPLGKKATFRTGYSGGWVSGSRLFQNELYQIGGFRLLRGFDEKSIYASQYHMLSLELRLLLSRNSNVYLFSDNGWVQSRYNGFSRDAFYNGFGVGTSLETKTGIFTITYALGRSDISALQLRQSKIHFGYVAYF